MSPSRVLSVLGLQDFSTLFSACTSRPLRLGGELILANSLTADAEGAKGLAAKKPS